MGLVQRSREEGRQLGRQEGLLKGIALGLKLKFGAAGEALLPEISRIEDATLLEAILRSLETTDELDAVRRIYH
jgi:predicted transposase YdaD